jgi:3-oxoacyl-[acyl-carrier protein] reductase
MSRSAVTPMRKQGWGRIISISSAAAKYGRKHLAVYSASKAAIIGFTHSLGVELAPYGITVNAVCPGATRTSRALSSARRNYSGIDLETALAKRAEHIPVGRQGRPEEIAAMVAFLASDASSYVTSQAISVCGGTTF